MAKEIKKSDLAKMEEYLETMEVKPLDKATVKLMARRVAFRLDNAKRNRAEIETQKKVAAVIAVIARRSAARRLILKVASHVATAAAVLACVMMNRWSESSPKRDVVSNPVPSLRAVVRVSPAEDAASTPDEAPESVGASQLPPAHDPVAESPAETKLETPKFQPAETPLIYVVKKGDTLSQIAEKKLGSHRLWQKISDANGEIAPDSLRPGMKLKLPAVAGAIEVSAAG